MEKMVNIKEGLEITGTINTEPEASVYKGKDKRNTFSAIRLIPKPVFQGKIGEDQLTYIKLELAKLKRSGETIHDNVVQILDTGQSLSGNSYYIEMAFIDGPNLEERLQQLSQPVFNVKEIMLVADHLSKAIEYLHDMKIIHGGIKTSNIRWNRESGNYVLVDLGSAIMPPRTHSIMPGLSSSQCVSPEQQAGQLLYPSDIYSFGCVLFRLLTGTYPPSGNEKALTLDPQKQPAGIITELLSERKANIPATWTRVEKEQESQVPDWLTELTAKCLEPNPLHRFGNGRELRKFIALKSSLVKTKQGNIEEAELLRKEVEKLSREKEQLQQALAQHELTDKIMFRQWKETDEQLSTKVKELDELKQKLSRPVITVPVLIGLLVVAMLAGAFGFYILSPVKGDNLPASQPGSVSRINETTDQVIKNEANTKPPSSEVPAIKKNIPEKASVPIKEKLPSSETEKKNQEKEAESSIAPEVITPTKAPAETVSRFGEYKVKSKAYFHDGPDDNSRRSAFIIHWNKVVLKPTDEQDNYVYVVFTNHLGQTSKGWLNKDDLIRLK